MPGLSLRSLKKTIDFKRISRLDTLTAIIKKIELEPSSIESGILIDFLASRFNFELDGVWFDGSQFEQLSDESKAECDEINEQIRSKQFSIDHLIAVTRFLADRFNQHRLRVLH